jgi:hypothetical protein
MVGKTRKRNAAHIEDSSDKEIEPKREECTEAELAPEDVVMVCLLHGGFLGVAIYDAVDNEV